jgi:hypothetical protein
MNSQLLQLAGENGFKKVASTGGGEYAGACPSCGGSDRFRIWPEKDRFWCRKCGKSGDSIEFLKWIKGLSYADACRELDVPTKRRRVLRSTNQDWWRTKPEPVSFSPPAPDNCNAQPENKTLQEPINEAESFSSKEVALNQETGGPQGLFISQPETAPVTEKQPIAIEIPAVKIVQAPSISPEGREAPADHWRNLEPLDMLPLNRRAEAAEIIQADPNKRQILSLCKVGVYDCFTAMKKLGMPEPFRLSWGGQ